MLVDLVHEHLLHVACALCGVVLFVHCMLILTVFQAINIVFAFHRVLSILLTPLLVQNADSETADIMDLPVTRANSSQVIGSVKEEEDTFDITNAVPELYATVMSKLSELPDKIIRGRNIITERDEHLFLKILV